MGIGGQEVEVLLGVVPLPLGHVLGSDPVVEGALDVELLDVQPLREEIAHDDQPVLLVGHLEGYVDGDITTLTLYYLAGEEAVELGHERVGVVAKVLEVLLQDPLQKDGLLLLHGLDEVGVIGSDVEARAGGTSRVRQLHQRLGA